MADKPSDKKKPIPKKKESESDKLIRSLSSQDKGVLVIND